MNKVHFSNSWQSEKNGTRNEMKKKKKKREETSRCLPASAAKWTYLESNPFPQLMLRPLLLSSFFSLLILCLASFINPVYTERLGQSDMLTKCTYICTYTYTYFSFFLTRFPTEKKPPWNVCGVFSPLHIKKKKNLANVACTFTERTKQEAWTHKKLFTDTWSLL